MGISLSGSWTEREERERVAWGEHRSKEVYQSHFSCYFCLFIRMGVPRASLTVDGKEPIEWERLKGMEGGTDP